MNWIGMALLMSAALTPGAHRRPTSINQLPDRPTIVPPFNVRVDLTPKAAAALKQRGETIMVTADFYAYPNARGALLVDDDANDIHWSRRQTIELKGAGVATFGPRKFNRALIDYFDDGKPKVNINVYSGRRTSPNNFLDCELWDDSVYVAASKGARVKCDLLYIGDVPAYEVKIEPFGQ